VYDEDYSNALLPFWVGGQASAIVDLPSADVESCEDTPVTS